MKSQVLKGNTSWRVKSLGTSGVVGLYIFQVITVLNWNVTKQAIDYVKETVVIFKPELNLKYNDESIHLSTVLQPHYPPAHTHFKFQDFYCATVSIFTSEQSCSNQLLSYDKQEQVKTRTVLYISNMVSVDCSVGKRRNTQLNSIIVKHTWPSSGLTAQ